MPEIVDVTEQLISALPSVGDRSEMQVHADYPLAFDASGTKSDLFLATAQSPDVATALSEGRTYIRTHEEARLSRLACYGNPTRMGEYAGCLLKRALGKCPEYDVEAGRERTPEEFNKWIKENL